MARTGEESSIPLLALNYRRSYESDSSHRQRDENIASSVSSSSSTLLADFDIEDQQKDEDENLTRLPDTTAPLASSSNPRSSTSFLDGLRGLAALMVVLQHANPRNENDSKRGFGQDGHWDVTLLPVVRLFIIGGDPAVPVFFVLSGYVLSIGALALNRRGQWQSTFRRLASAALRRPFRLYISPLVISFLIALIMQLPFGVNPAIFLPPKDTLSEELSRWWELSVLMFNPFKFQPVWYTWYIYDISVWTLPLELKGSMLIYAILGLDALSSIKALPHRAWIVLFVLTFMTTMLLFTSFWAMACFVAGITLASLEVYEFDKSIHNRLSALARRIWTNALFITGLYLLSEPTHWSFPEYSLNTPGWHTLALLIPPMYTNDDYGRFWTSIGAILIVFTTFHLPYLRRFFSTRPLQYLGKVSFMLYLVHEPIHASFAILDRMLGDIPDFSAESKWDNWLYVPDFGPPAASLRYFVALLIQMPVFLLTADLLTRVLDMPSVNAGKWVTRRIGLDGERK